MLKATSIKILTFGLILLVTACSSAAASQPAPAMEVMPTATAAKSDITEEPAAQESMAEVKEESAPVAETMAESKESMPVADESMPEVEESQVVTDEAMTEAEESAATAAEVMTKVEESQPVPAEAMGESETPPVAEKPAAMESKSTETALMKDDILMTETGPTATQAELLATLKNQGTPPELLNEVWLNSQPLKLADLHDKVVIVEFWTFGCINCKHVIPTLREWHQKYQAEGLVIIGVHTPEFDYESEVENVKQAVLDQDIPYAVAIDNNWVTWRSYNNRYWPAKYFIDKAGQLRHVAIGEGHYEQQEEIIQALLAEKVS